MMRKLGLAARLAIIGLAIGAAILSATGAIGPTGLMSLPYTAMGATLVIRRPKTSIGWILIGLGACYALISMPVTASPTQFADGSVEPHVAIFAIVHAGLGTTAFFLYAVMVVVFPSGRLPVGPWGQRGRAALGAGLVCAVTAYLMPEIPVGYPLSAWVRNPVALLPDLSIWGVINPGTVILPVMILVIAGAVSLIVRARRATGTERQQLRWLGASFAVVMSAVVSGIVIGYLVPGSSDTGLAWIPAMLAFPTVPIAIGIAVLRYRLYEIDRIISRTIAWAVSTGVLGAVFAGVVIALQGALVNVTQGQTLAVAVSTLVAYALFQPVRGRVQSAVDRRFDRARYDGRRTVDAFAERLRNEVDLATLSGAVLVTADEAVRPAAAGLWLRGAPR